MSAQRTILVASDAGISIYSLRDIPKLIGACFGVEGVLLAEKDLGPDFFDLKSGVAGELFQKLTNYRVRTAIVLPHPEVYGQRFRELAYEHRLHSLIRFVESQSEAEAWLLG